jgi:hypothetical protein
MPKVVAFFNEYAKGFKEQALQAPKVVSMVPKNGATNVDPRLKEMKITFDRPMKDGCTVTGNDYSSVPEVTGKYFYDESRKVFTLPIKLEPGRRYEFWLNRGEFNKFKSEQGIPLDSVHVQFQTRAK